MRRSEVLAAEAVSCLNKALIRLKDVWEEIGIPEEQRLERTQTVKKHIQGLLEMMVAEEESLKLRLEKSVEATRAKIQDLSLELDLPQTQEAPGPLLQAQEQLRRRVEELLREKVQRMETLKLLLQQDQHLATILGTASYPIDHTHPPSPRQLDDLRQHLANQREEQVQRTLRFQTLRDQILLLFTDLDHSPDSELEKNLVQSNPDFCLSLKTLDSLVHLQLQLQDRRAELQDQVRLIQDQVQSLWNRLELPQNQQSMFLQNLPQKTSPRLQQLQQELQRVQQLWEDGLRAVCSRTRVQVSELWDKCFCSEEQRLDFTLYHSDQVSEQVLEALEAELQRLTQFYEEHRPILEAVQKWIDQWALFLELERKASDPARFTNRGGNLLKEERQRAELSKSLHKLQRELKAQTLETPVLVKGVDFLQFVDQQWSLLQQQKEQEKNLRHLKKARQTEEDMMYGTTVRTPTKRRFVNSISSPRGPSPRCSQASRGLNKTRRAPLGGCSLFTNSSLRSATGQACRSPGPRPPQVPLVRTPVQSKPPQPRVPALNQDQTWTKSGRNQVSVWTQEQKENRPQVPESPTLSSVASTYSQFLRDLSEPDTKVQNQVLNSTDL